MSFLSIQSYATAVYLLLVFPSFNHWCMLWLLLFNHCLFKLSRAWFLFVMVLIQTSALKEREGEEFSEDLNLGIWWRSRGYNLLYHWQCGGFPKLLSFESLQRASKNWIELGLQIGKYGLWLVDFLLLFCNSTINTFSSLLIYGRKKLRYSRSTVPRLLKNCPFHWYCKLRQLERYLLQSLKKWQREKK